MRKLYIFGLIGLVALIIGLAFADQMTFTTYYPAPYGVYNNMRVMNSLGVGTTEPEAILDVKSTSSGFLPPRMSEAERDAIVTAGDAVPGMMIYNQDADAKSIQYWIGDQWRSMPEIKIQSGTAVRSPQWDTVSFPVPFSEVPTVVATPGESSPGGLYYIVAIKNITKTSFQFREVNVAGGQHNGFDPIYWIAVEQ